jgi:hypothetical protein
VFFASCAHVQAPPRHPLTLWPIRGLKKPSNQYAPSALPPARRADRSTSTPLGVTAEKQREILSEIRVLQNAIPVAQFARDDRLAALALSGAVSRRDMARACGLNKSRIDQIIATHAQRFEDDRNGLLLERARSHMPAQTTPLPRTENVDTPTSSSAGSGSLGAQAFRIAGRAPRVALESAP